MKLVLVLCALVGLSKAFSVPNSEIFTNWESRIVGGSNAVPGQFPHQVSLRTAGNLHFCGGFIHTSRWVVSAAHCTIERTPANTRVVVGAISRTTGGTSYNTIRITNHPLYNPNTLANDISIVRTAATIAFNTNVKAIPLALTIPHTGGGVPAVVSGWGQTANPGSAAANLQYLNVSTLTNADCRDRHTASNSGKVFDHKICTLAPVGGACMGDSGGPLVANGIAIGVVSWGIPCGTGAPDVYDRISSHRVWILAAVLAGDAADLILGLL